MPSDIYKLANASIKATLIIGYYTVNCTGLHWRNLRFKMERIRKKGKQHDSAGCDISDSTDHRRKLAGS